MNEINLLSIMNNINPSKLSYTDWVQVGMALKHEGYSAYDWDLWSSKDTERYKSRECYLKWRAFNEQTKINHAKSELRNYMYLLNVCHKYESRIIELETQLEAVKSSAAPLILGNSGLTPEERKNELRDKLQIYLKELALVRYRTDKIKNFLDSLEYSDRVIVTDIYIKNINIENVAMRFYCSERTRRRKVDELMVKY